MLVADAISNQKEIERRAYLWSKNNTLDDDITSLLYDGNPNDAIDGNTAGETKLHALPATVSMYVQSTGELWFKESSPNNWSQIVASATGTPTRLGAKDIDGTTNAIDTDIALYTVGASTYARQLSVSMCNRNNTTASVRLAHVNGAIGDVANEDYIFYNSLFQSYETKVVTIDGMIATDTLLVRSDTTNLSFVAYGQELTTDPKINRLGATTVSASTETALYTATTGVTDISIVACNKDPANSATIRIALIDGAIGDWAVEDNLFYGEILIEVESRIYNIDVCMANTDTIGVYSSDADVNFICYGRTL